MLAHRWAWTQKHGRIASGVVLHHTCRRRECVRTAHLLPVARPEHKAIEGAEDAVIEAARNTTPAEIAALPRITESESKLNPLGALRAHELAEVTG